MPSATSPATMNCFMATMLREKEKGKRKKAKGKGEGKAPAAGASGLPQRLDRLHASVGGLLKKCFPRPTDAVHLRNLPGVGGLAGRRNVQKSLTMDARGVGRRRSARA